MMKFVKNQNARGINKQRRDFLNIVGRSGISTGLLKASPLLMGVMSSRYAQAQSAANKRLILTYMGNGCPDGAWLPDSATEMKSGTAPFLNGGPASNGYNVANYVHFHECQTAQPGHSRPWATTNPTGHHLGADTSTVDARISNNNFFGTPIDNIRLAGNSPARNANMSIDSGNVVLPITGPKQAFNDLFNGASVSRDDTTYLKVFEMNARAIESIQTKLGLDERGRLENHLSTLQRIETNLTAAAEEAGTGEVCAPLANDRYSADFEYGLMLDNNMLPDFFALADIAVAALQCGLTNVLSLCIGDGQGEYALPTDAWAALQNDVPVFRTMNNDYHSQSHSGIPAHEHGIMMAAFQQVPAYILSRLAEVSAPGEAEPLINSTLMCHVNGMGDTQHGGGNSPWFLASGSQEYGLGSFNATRGGTGIELLESIPARMGVLA